MEKIKKKHLYQYYSEIFQSKKSVLFFQINNIESFNSYLDTLKMEFLLKEVVVETFFLKNSIFKKVLQKTPFSKIVPLISGQIFVVSFESSSPSEGIFDNLLSTLNSVVFLGGIFKDQFIVSEDLTYLRQIHGKDVNPFLLLNSLVVSTNVSLLNHLCSEQKSLLYLLEQRKRQLCSSH